MPPIFLLGKQLETNAGDRVQWLMTLLSLLRERICSQKKAFTIKLYGAWSPRWETYGRAYQKIAGQPITSNGSFYAGPPRVHSVLKYWWQIGKTKHWGTPQILSRGAGSVKLSEGKKSDGTHASNMALWHLSISSGAREAGKGTGEVSRGQASHLKNICNDVRHVIVTFPARFMLYLSFKTPENVTQITFNQCPY